MYMKQNQKIQTAPVRRGFTLIELLVVVAIIALLMSILLPSLSGAREQAKRVMCGVNQRTCALAAVQYTQENKDWFNAIQDMHRNVGPRPVEGTWRIYLWKYVAQMPAAYDCPSERDERYADGISAHDAKVLGQPSLKDPLNFGKLNILEIRNASGIGANLAHYWAGTEGHGPFGRPKESGYQEGLTRAGPNVKSPGKLILFGDGHGDALGDWPEDRFWIFFWDPPLPVGGPGYDRILQGDPGAVRHKGRANYAFYDGSVQTLKASKIPCTPEECWWSVELRPHLKHATTPH